MNDGPVVDFHDVLIAEIERSRFPTLAKRGQDDDNRLPQLVLHDFLLLVMLQEISWALTVFGARPNVAGRKKLNCKANYPARRVMRSGYFSSHIQSCWRKFGRL